MKKRFILILVGLVLLLGAAAGAYAATSRWNRPLGPSLGLPSLTPPVAGQSTSAPAGAESIHSAPQGIAKQGTSQPQAGNSTSSAASLPPTTPAPPLCDGPVVMNILAVGMDYRGSEYLYGLADSIHVMRIDFTQPSALVVDFPRDLWVEIPDIADHYGITHGKLNQAYLFGNPGMGYYDGPGEGPGLLARTLDVNFGMRVDHYIAINMETFINVIDAVGGVDVYLEEPGDLNSAGATPDPLLYLPAGWNHLNGETALLLVQNRIPTTFHRMQNQNLVLSALRDKLLSPAMLPQLPGLMARFISSAQTDLSPSQLNSLVCIVQKLNGDNTRAVSFPEDMFTASTHYDPYRKVDTFIYEADFDQLRAMVADFMNGIWP